MGEPTFANQAEVRSINLVVTSAEVVLHKGDRSADTANAYDARELLALKQQP